MASSPNVRRSPNSATGADAESAATAADAAAASAADAASAAAAAADAASAAAAATTEAKNPVVWKRPNMRGSKCSINGYVRLGIVKAIIAELRSVGDDTCRDFRESCLGHFIREEWGGFVSNAALHTLFSNDVNVGVACGPSASWFLMLHDASTLIDAEVTFGCIYGILQFDPGFVGVRWLDDWAAQTVLVHTSFLATCINVWNNSKRKGGQLSIDDEDLNFLVSHIHGLRPFWVDHRPCVDHLEYVPRVLVRTLACSPY
ncbi:hypothetical protein OROHE_012541 [Orobanche hederae]